MQVVVDSEWLAVSYILAAVFFILALKGLGTEETAIFGTQCGIVGMLVTVGFSIASDYVQDEAYYIIPICIVPCSIFGIWYAYSVITDRLPELVGLFNSFGGLAAALEGIAVYTDRTAVLSMYTGAPLNATEQKIQLVVLYLSIMVGMMTFTGSVVAVLKLTGEWVKHPHKIDGVRLSADGVATFPKAHKVRQGYVDKKTGRNIDSDVLSQRDAKGRVNRYALDLEFASGDKTITLTAFGINDSKTLQMTSNKKNEAADMSKAKEFDAGATYTCTWTHETENFWHINSKARALCGGKIPQIILLLGCLACCVITYVLDETTCGKDGCLPGQMGKPLYLSDNELLGTTLIIVLAVLSGIIGILQAMAVSGADMAVVICVLNSGSGWSGVAAGFMISNELLLVTGAFVGASGAILSYLMCEAMNVPILRVLGMMAPPKEVEKTGDAEELPEPQLEDAAKIADRLREAKTVIIAPGYGMAAGKAQGVVGKLAETLRDQGKEVRFCIHPVAGRLPGHMNILLAEAQVPYDWVCAMEEINPDFKNTDIALCVGAWDTVNPAAAEDPDCPVYGMPMCRVWDAKICVVNKRSLGSASGFSGAQNILPHKENTRMLLGSAADKVQELLDIIGKDAKAEGRAEEGIAAVAGPTGPTKEELAAMPTYGKTICVPKETSDPNGNILEDENAELRCAMSPKAALHLRQKLGFEVIVEAGCGARSLITDEMYEAVGAKVVPTGAGLYESADIMLKVNPPVCRKDIGGKHELDMLKENATYIGFLPIMNPGDTPKKCGDDFKDIVLRAVDKKINLLSMGHLPRISRAQKSDALSTFGKLAGHRACIEAASAYGRIMPGEITSAGKNPQAKAWVGGCGVAGLEAVAILKKMGCEVYATDVRDIEDQIISVGGKFVHYDPEGLKKAKDSGGYAPSFGPEVQVMQDKMYSEWSAKMDVMVLTAAIPGRPPPQLVSKDMVANMKAGSVIVDIAASAKWASQYNASDPRSPWPGNCELTVPGTIVQTANGVKIIGYTDMPSRFGNQATDFYANNLVSLLEDMCAKGTIADRGLKEPELGTAADFKIDMHVVRAQDESHESYSKGQFAEGDDVMAGMVLVKVENGQAMLDHPKERKPMETAQAIFEKQIKGEALTIAAMEAKLETLKEQQSKSSRNLKAMFNTEDVSEAFKHVSSEANPEKKVEACLTFRETKSHADMVKWMSGMIKKEKQEAIKRDKEERLKALQAAKTESGPCGTIILTLLGLGACGVMGFYPFPQYFIGNMMIFVLASVLGYCLVASVKPSLHTPLMSMSNAISGIVIIGGMYQIQGKWLWGGEGWPAGLPIAEGGITLTQVLGAVAVAISAINIAGGFAVTFRMLAMFQSSDKAKP